jgi:hypothetical protein
MSDGELSRTPRYERVLESPAEIACAMNKSFAEGG